MNTETALRTFFSSKNYAVVGASSNPAKFGNQVLAWYLNHSLRVTPINPTSKTIDVSGKSYEAVSSLSKLPEDKVADTSVSVITQPEVTLKVLQEARKLGIPAVWLQPGSFNDEVIKYAREDGAFKAVLAGDGGRGHEGWCVLVDGEAGLRAAEKL